MANIPPNRKDFDVPEIDQNLKAVMDELLNRHMFTYYALGKTERLNIRHAFILGFEFARMGFLSQEVK